MASESELEKAREAFADTLEVLDRLRDHIDSLDDLVSMIRLAVGTDGSPSNNSQLRLLYGLVRNRKK